MAQRVLGIIVTGGTPVGTLGMGADAALTPFGGKYRFIDFALATLFNAGLPTVYVLAPGPTRRLRAHLGGIEGLIRPFLLTLPSGGAMAGRAARIMAAFAACRELVQRHEPEVLVILLADHILRLDPRPLCEACSNGGADMVLATLPAPANGLCRLAVDDRGRVLGPAPSNGLALTWSGDLALRAETLPALLAALTPDAAVDDPPLIATLAALVRLSAHDLGGARAPGWGAYWHEPSSLEAYYEAQMDLCTPRPALDLHDPAWRLPRVASGLAPAKVVADAAGRSGQALNALVADGSLIRGAAVINTVVGHDVIVESGAEVEDSILLDGTRVGCGARVRRAVVGVGATIPDWAVIGYGTPAPPARLLPSGLTLVPPAEH